MLYFLLLLAISLGILLSKAFPLLGKRGGAPATLSWSADLQSKFAYQRTNLISLVALLLLGTAFHLVPRIVSILTVVAAILILMLPLKFALSEEGIAANSRLLCLWTELKSYRLHERCLTLKGEGRLNFLALYLPKDPEMRKQAFGFIRKKSGWKNLTQK